MHHSGPFLQALKTPKQGFVGKNCQNGSQRKSCFTIFNCSQKSGCLSSSSFCECVLKTSPDSQIDMFKLYTKYGKEFLRGNILDNNGNHITITDFDQFISD